MPPVKVDANRSPRDGQCRRPGDDRSQVPLTLSRDLSRIAHTPNPAHVPATSAANFADSAARALAVRAARSVVFVQEAFTADWPRSLFFPSGVMSWWISARHTLVSPGWWSPGALY
jgi:hypothetical protein